MPAAKHKHHKKRLNAKSSAQVSIALRGVLTESGPGRTETTPKTGFPTSVFFSFREGEAPAEPNSSARALYFTLSKKKTGSLLPARCIGRLGRKSCQGIAPAGMYNSFSLLAATSSGVPEFHATGAVFPAS
jgi:hypothetical protein